MSSPEQKNLPFQDSLRHLPELKHHKHKNYTPVYSFLNGVLSLQDISLQDAVTIAEDVTDHFSDYLEGKRIRVIERIFHDIEEQLQRVSQVTVTHERVVKPKHKHEDDDVRNIYDEENSTKRVLLEDDEGCFLMVGYTLSDRGRIRPLLCNPHDPSRVEERKNSWLIETLKQGYWVITSKPSLPKEDEINSYGTK